MSRDRDVYTQTTHTPADLSSGPCAGRWRVCLTTGRLTPVANDEQWDFMRAMANARHRYPLDPADIVWPAGWGPHPVTGEGVRYDGGPIVLLERGPKAARRAAA